MIEGCEVDMVERTPPRIRRGLVKTRCIHVDSATRARHAFSTDMVLNSSPEITVGEVGCRFKLVSTASG
jgi:hypothetical protein